MDHSIQQPIFYEQVQRTNLKFSEQQLYTIHQQLSSIKTAKALMNPFTTSFVPSYEQKELPAILLLMGKQLQELPLSYLNFTNLQNFIKMNSKALCDLLAQNNFLCEVFCRTLNRFLQKLLQSKEKRQRLITIKQSQIVEFLLFLLIHQGENEVGTRSQFKQHFSDQLFYSVAWYSSLVFINEQPFKRLKKDAILQKALKISILLIENAQDPKNYEILRQFVNFTSYLLIFNSQDRKKPAYCYQFYLGLNQDFVKCQEKAIQINPNLIKQYYNCLNLYLQKDEQYLSYLIRMVKQLISLQIRSQPLRSHFSVLIKAIRIQAYPGLTKIVYQILIDVASKKMAQFVDTIFQDMLNCDPNLRTEQTQSLNRQLAEKGSKIRKLKFLQKYQKLQSKLDTRLTFQTLNFIIKTYFEERLNSHQFSIFIEKQEANFEGSTFGFLHQILLKTNCQHSFKLFAIFVEKRIQSWLKKVHKQNELELLVQQKWLQAAKNSEECYQIYLKSILSKVSLSTLHINHNNQSLDCGSLRLQINLITKFAATYKTLLRKAIQHQIFGQKVFIYMMYSQAVFGHQLVVNDFKYFDLFFRKVKGTQKIRQTINFIEYLVKMFMNSASVLLYLQAILAFEQSQPQFCSKRMYDLTFLTQSIAQSVFFKISTYSIESITILIQLSTRIDDEVFQNQCLAIFKAWSQVMSPIQCNNFCYLFCYRQIKKCFPFMTQKKVKKNEYRILKLWKLIIQLTDDNHESQYFLKFQQNKLQILTAFKKEEKVDLQISGQVLRNRIMDMKWDVFIIYTNIKVYQFYLKNQQCFLYSNNKQDSQKQVLQQLDLKQQTNSMQSFKVLLKINQVGENRYLLLFNIFDKPIQLKIAGNLEKIQSRCSSSIFINKLKIKNNLNQVGIFKEHVSNFGSGELKIKRVGYVKTIKFINKINFDLIFGLLAQILKHFRQFDPSEGYILLIKISCRVFSFLLPLAPHLYIPRQIQLLKVIFRLVLQGFARTKLSITIDFRLQLDQPMNYVYYLYHLYISALLPHHLWKFFTQTTKQHIISILCKCLEHKEFKKLENEGIEMFQILGQLVPFSTQKIEILHRIIETHESNQYLIIKFEHYLAKIGQIWVLKERIVAFISGLVDCIQSQFKECAVKKKVIRFLLFQSNLFEYILLYFNKQSKIKLIRYIFNNNIEANNSIRSLVEQIVATMDKEQKGQLVFLLVIQLQQDSLPLSKLIKISSFHQKQLIQKARSTQKNQLYLKLYLIIKIWSDMELDTLQDVIITLKLFLQQRVMNPKNILLIRQGTENTICTSKYINFLFKIKMTKQQNAAYKDNFDKIYEHSLQIIFQSQKQKQIKFMQNYLQCALSNLQFALLPFTQQRVKTFKLCNHIVTLQYIYEIFIKMKYAGCCFEDQLAPARFSQAVMAYIQFLVVNIEGTKEICKPLLFVYPQIALSKNMPLQKTIQLIKTAQSEENRQIKGGIYYKLMIILLQLLQNCIQVDFTRLIELLLILKQTEKKSKFWFITKFKQRIENQSLIQGQLLQRQIQTLREEHLSFYKELSSGQTLVKQKEISLSAYLIDFFVMRLCQYLKSYCEDLDQNILRSYSNIVLNFFKSYNIEHISASMTSQILKYQDLLYLSNPQISNINSKQINNNNYGKRQSYIDDAISKLIDIEQAFDPRLLCRLFRDLNIPFCFGTREKQIRFLQFLDIHNILNRKRESQENPVIQLSQSAKFQLLLQQNYKSIKNYKKKIEFNELDFIFRKIKMIYPYTSPNRTVMRIMDHCFDNMSSPITQFIACKDYSLKKLSHLESSNMVYFQQNNYDQASSIAEKGLLKQLLAKLEAQQGHLEDSLSQIKKGNQYCELVTREGVYFCQWHLSVNNLRLQPLKQRPSTKELEYLIKGTHNMNLITKSLATVYIQFSEIEEIFYRKFCQIFNSIQIFLKNGTSKFINLYQRSHLYAFIKILESMVKGIKIIRQPTKQFIIKNFTQKWVEGHLSNFDYLMMLNKYSGRTHNDLNQYYVFPWVLSDYKSNRLDLSNPNAFRDLSKPIGAQNPQKLQRFKFLFKNNNRSHYYGSHYSTSLFVLYYLVRLQPFSTLHRDMQKGDFDAPDRLFCSMQQVWSSLLSPSFISDIKQLIPEFYYLPVFLKNVGNIQFGQKMCGEEVSDVVLPQWAENPQELILTFRAALQSDWVSKNLHLWIDLIFGVHQHSQKKYNMFLQSSYEQKAQQMWKIRPISEGIIHQIMYFGQCPSKLFSNQHRPKRLLPELKLQKSMHRVNQQFPFSSTSFVQIKHDLKVIKLSKYNQRFKIEVEKINKGIFLQTETEPQSTLEQLRLNFKYLSSKDKAKVQNLGAANKKKISLFNTELRVGKEPVLALEMNYVFEHTEVNELWIACYGLLGLRVYNWQQQLYWKWQKEEVCKVYVEATRMIFATPSGKLCFYSFFNRQLDEIQVISQCSTMLMEVHCLPRFPTLKQNKNEIQYRILCAFDHKKLTFVNYVFRQVFNYSSLKKYKFVDKELYDHQKLLQAIVRQKTKQSQ